MPRIKRGTTTRRKHNKLKKSVKGFIKTRRASVKRAREAILKAGVNAYIGRKQNKRNFRRIWILRINAGLKPYDISYSVFIKKLADKKIGLNRKILAYFAAEEPEVFKKIVEEAK